MLGSAFDIPKFTRSWLLFPIPWSYIYIYMCLLKQIILCFRLYTGCTANYLFVKIKRNYVILILYLTNHNIFQKLAEPIVIE